MSSSILVGYATRYGSKQEVAKTVAAVLCEPEIHAWARALAAKVAPALHETEAQR